MPDPSVTIRLARPDDAPAMAEVHVCSWLAAYKDIIPEAFMAQKNAERPALYKRVITKENTNSYVIEREGKIIGIMRVAPPQDTDLNDNAYELHYLYLHPAVFRLGIGTAAMSFACRLAKNLDKTTLVLWVAAENAAAIGFYKACGFSPDGRTKTHDYGKAVESIRMQKKL